MPMTRLTALLALGLLAACAQPSRMSEMVVTVSPGEQLVSQSAPALAQAVTIGTVEGGSGTIAIGMSQVDNDALRGALEASLVAHRLYASPAQARYRLSANLQELRQPFMGFDMTVTSSILWTLADAASGATAWQDLVVTPHTARFSEALIAVERLRLANEGAIKVNLTEMLRRLARFSPGAPVAPVAPTPTTPAPTTPPSS
jgi:hypothetical protein